MWRCPANQLLTIPAKEMKGLETTHSAACGGSNVFSKKSTLISRMGEEHHALPLNLCPCEPRKVQVVSVETCEQAVIQRSGAE